MPSLGIAISRDAIHAVLARGVRVVSRERTDVGSHETIENALERIINALPSTRFTPRITLAVGIAHSEVKPLCGLPPASDERMLTRIVRANASAFFLGGGDAAIVSGVDRRASGAAWGAAFDGRVVEPLVDVLQRRGLTRITVVPALTTTSVLLGQGIRLCTDGDVAVEVETDANGDVQSVRRVPAVPIDVDDEYLDAYAAAVASRLTAMTWRPPMPTRRRRRIARLRLAGSIALVLATGLSALVAPGAHAARDAARMRAELARTAARRTDAERVKHELDRVDMRLERIDLFNATRGQATMLLAEIAIALPESTAIVSLRVDSLEGTFVALAPRATAIVARLGNVRAIEQVRIVGSLTHETQGAARVERATVRFRFPRAPRSDR